MEGVVVLLVVIFIYSLFGVVAASIAKRKGRSVAGWFWGGFFLHIVGIIIVAVLPDLKAQAAYRERVEAENRRLREQVRQERMKNETFRDYSMKRLDAHDQALGIDTRAALPPVEGAAPELAWPADAGTPPPVNPDGTLWYYELGGEAKGPVAASELRRLAAAGEIASATLVWTEGMAEWAPMATVPTLAVVQS